MKNLAPDPSWNADDDTRLVQLAKQGLSADEISQELCRSARAVRDRGKRLRIHFKKDRSVERHFSAVKGTTAAFAPGDRVRLSALGRNRHPKMLDVPGTVVKPTNSPSSIGVLFDGRRTPVRMHRAYLDRCETLD